MCEIARVYFGVDVVCIIYLALVNFIYISLKTFFSIAAALFIILEATSFLLDQLSCVSNFKKTFCCKENKDIIINGICEPTQKKVGHNIDGPPPPKVTKRGACVTSVKESLSSVWAPVVTQAGRSAGCDSVPGSLMLRTHLNISRSSQQFYQFGRSVIYWLVNISNKLGVMGYR